jgi:ElaB/YqjD/DUF883 family membrane-anchored ribosome-binding protein
MLSDSTSQHAPDQVALLRLQYGDLRTHFATLCDSAHLTATAAVRETDRTIRDYPYRSLAVALGLGVVIGLVLNRDRA